MPTTANYGFYSPPLTGVTPNVPRDAKTLADAVDAALKAEETARIAGDAPQVSIPDSDAGFPAPFVSQTTATVVIDRFTVAAVPYVRRAAMSANTYIVTNVDLTQINFALMAGSTIIGYCRKAISGNNSPDCLYATGKYEIPANTAVVFEVRVSRQLGTGAFNTSISNALTNTNLILTKV